jgi:hypothetical protein
MYFETEKGPEETGVVFWLNKGVLDGFQTAATEQQSISISNINKNEVAVKQGFKQDVQPNESSRAPNAADSIVTANSFAYYSY